MVVTEQTHSCPGITRRQKRMNFLKEEVVCDRTKCRISCRLGASNSQSLNSLRSEGWYMPRKPAHIAPSALDESRATNRAPGRLHFHIPMYAVPLIHNLNVFESCLIDLSPFLKFQSLGRAVGSSFHHVLHLDRPEGPRLRNLFCWTSILWCTP